MIGMVNVQCDSTMDFYAAPSSSKNGHPTSRPLFGRRKIEKIAYSADGRKMSNGEVLEKHSPNKLWEELIIRTFAKKVEDDVKCPLEGMRQLGEGIQTIRNLDRQQSCSMYSLVSDHRLMAEIEEGEKDEEHFHQQQQQRPLKGLIEEPYMGFGDDGCDGVRERATSTVSYPETAAKITKIAAARRHHSHHAKRASDIL
ncbi:unnamed protein product, partial [Mesorhabditis belari]|uniref:Uncharacterized protein n=1 Tax=Mesorhabditis belari TaxID=2138241 RepID=A0AAF3EHN4_9BILA